MILLSLSMHYIPIKTNTYSSIVIIQVLSSFSINIIRNDVTVKDDDNPST